MLTQSQLREVRSKYVSEHYEDEERPEMTALCRECGIFDPSEVRFAQRAAQKGNWEAHRLTHRARVLAMVEDKEAVELDRLTDQLVAIKTQFLREMVQNVDSLLPEILSLVRAKISIGFIDDKALVSVMKLLMDERRHVLSMIDDHEGKRQAKPQEQDNTRLSALLEDAGVLSHTLSIIKGEIKSEEWNEEKAELTSFVLKAELDALEKLDEEVGSSG